MNEGNTLSKGEELRKTAVQWLLEDGINIGKAILIALIIFVVGLWITGAIKNKLRSTMEKWNVDPALISFKAAVTTAAFFRYERSPRAHSNPSNRLLAEFGSLN